MPDSNTDTVYTNYAGEMMLKDYHDATSGLDYDSYTQFDSSGRITLQAQPSAVTGYNDANANLGVTMNSSSGRINKIDYYTSTTAGETTAGGVAGYEQDEKVQQGSSGTAITLNATQYFQHTANSISVDPVANYTQYRNIDGTGGEVTSYGYTWFTGSTQMQSEAVSAPTISSGQKWPRLR